MDQPTSDFVMHVIDNVRDLTLATVREDGYPQATTVGFAHDGLTFYVGIAKHSQKAHNVRRNNKVSLAMTLPYQNWNEIRGLSMSAIAEVLEDPAECEKAKACLVRRFPQLSEWAGTDMAEQVALLRITPQVISVLDYTKGFGHTELVTA
jgi:general stress protein 26